MDDREMRHRIKTAMVGRLATISPEGRPQMVPITFAPADGSLYFAVDQKPKRTRHLQRLRNIAANPYVSVLVDHYEDDWSALWWVRVDGTARILEEGAEFEEAVSLLTARYEQYRSNRPAGPVVEIKVERMTGWSAS